MKTNQHLILLRGLPGAGKTTFAKLIAEHDNYPYFSVDDYFTDENGNYKFEFSQNYKAYEQCLNYTENAIKQGAKRIIVHNTFTMDWELDPYFKLAKSYNCTLHVITLEHYHQGRNKHDVTDEQLQKMAEKYQVKLF
jgi:predicted kinase